MLRRQILRVSCGRRAPARDADRRALGLSRGTIRAALRRLIEEGLVCHVPYTGYQVIDLSDHDLWELYTLRGALESLGDAPRGPADRRAPASGSCARHSRSCWRRRSRKITRRRIGWIASCTSSSSGSPATSGCWITTCASRTSSGSTSRSRTARWMRGRSASRIASWWRASAPGMPSARRAGAREHRAAGADSGQRGVMSGVRFRLETDPPRVLARAAAAHDGVAGALAAGALPGPANLDPAHPAAPLRSAPPAGGPGPGPRRASLARDRARLAFSDGYVGEYELSRLAEEHRPGGRSAAGDPVARRSRRWRPSASMAARLDER